MLINDEYEKLAKLLYPSIEASGNVYYGQTRKLSLDELFDKNNGGFESWIDLSKSYDGQNEHNSKPLRCMFWKLGPFSGKIRLSVGVKNSTDVFAKYKIELNTVKKDNIIPSGDFNTYEVNANCSWVGYVGTNCVSPVNDEDALNNDITFCIDNKNKYLYIRLVSFDENGDVADWKENDYFAANIKQPLTLTCVTDGYVGLHLPFSNSINKSHFNSYEYSLNNGKWTHWEIGKTGFHPNVYEEGSETTYNGVVEWADLKPIKMNKDDTLKVRCFGNFVLDNLQVYHATSCTHFLLSGTYNLSGNGFSMTRGTAYTNVVDAQPLELMHLFSDYGNIGSIYEEITHEYNDDSCSHGHVDNIIWNGGIVDASAFALPATKLAKSCYECMFFSDKQLKYPPRLPATQLAASCYRSMFSYCDKLEKVPILPAEHFDENCHDCYKHMFYKCSSLETAHYFICDDQYMFNSSSVNTYFHEMYYQCANIDKLYIRDSFSKLPDIFGFNMTDVSVFAKEAMYLDQIFNNNITFNKLETLNKLAIEAGVWEDNSNGAHKNTAKLCLRQPLKEVTTFGYNNDDYKPEYDENGNFKNPTIYNGEFKKGGLQQKVYGRKEFVNPVVFDNGVYTRNGFIADTEYENPDNSAKNNFTISTNSKTDSIVLQSGTVEIKADSIKSQQIETISLQRKEITGIEYDPWSKTYDGPSDVEDFVILAAASYMMTTIYIAGFADNVSSIFSLLLQLANGDIDKNQFDQSISEMTGISVDNVNVFFAVLIVGIALMRVPGAQYANTLYITGKKITYKVASVEECEAYYTNNIDYTQTTIPVAAECISNILTFISNNKYSIKYSLYPLPSNLGESSCPFFNTYTNSIYCDNYYYANGDPVKFCNCTPSTSTPTEPEVTPPQKQFAVQRYALYIEFDTNESKESNLNALNEEILSLGKGDEISIDPTGTVIFDQYSVGTKIDYGDAFSSDSGEFRGKTLKFKSKPIFEYIHTSDAIIEVSDEQRKVWEQLAVEAALGATAAKAEHDMRVTKIHDRYKDPYIAELLEVLGVSHDFPKYFGHLRGGNVDISDIVQWTDPVRDPTKYDKLTDYSDVYKNKGNFKINVYETVITKNKAEDTYDVVNLKPETLTKVETVEDAKRNNPFAIIAENTSLINKQTELIAKENLSTAEETELIKISNAIEETGINRSINVNRNIIENTLSNAEKIRVNLSL